VTCWLSFSVRTFQASQSLLYHCTGWRLQSTGDSELLRMQVVVRVRPMFDVEAARGEQYAVQTHTDDPRHLQVLL